MTTTSNDASRLQKSLLEEVKRIAAEESTAINQFINVAVAEQAAAHNAGRLLDGAMGFSLDQGHQ